MATDSEIIQQIQHGDTTAFGRLVQKYQAEILKICQVILKNPQDAEEAAQDTFVQAYLKLDQLKQLDKFFAWLKQIAKNLSRNYRRQRRENVIALEQLTDEPEMFASRSNRAKPDAYGSRWPAPDESVLRQELMEAVMEAIETLPPKDRAVIWAYMDGLSHEAISNKLGISYQASMSRLYRARRKITAHMSHLLSGVIGLPRMFLKKTFSGGILAMKIGTSAKITAGAIGLLAILIAGFISFRAPTKPPKEVSRNVLKQAGQTEVARERQSNKLLSQRNRSQVESPQKPLASSAENTEISDEEIDRIIEFFEKLESFDVAKAPSIEKVSEYDQADTAKSYDERYDMLIEICQQIEPILDRIGQIGDELMRRHDEVIRLVEVKSKVGYLTEGEMSIIRELQPMVKECETLHAEYTTLPDKVKDVIPEAVKTETIDMPDTLPDVVKDIIPEAANIKIDLPDTMTMTYIDYNYIKSILGPVPEELDVYLSQFLKAGWGK